MKTYPLRRDVKKSYDESGKKLIHGLYLNSLRMRNEGVMRNCGDGGMNGCLMCSLLHLCVWSRGGRSFLLRLVLCGGKSRDVFFVKGLLFSSRLL